MGERPRLNISFSGGRTSALMTKLCVETYAETHDICITFANTGCEHEHTLKFVHQCDQHFGWGVVWLEAQFDLRHGKGVVAKVVDFRTASRKGEPFLNYIRKNGLPGPSNPSCSNRLKERCMGHYLKKTLGWKPGSYYTAIGIRADEIDRVNPNYKKHKFLYPLADAGITKEKVKLALRDWPFDLDLKSDAYGNCVHCFKKSRRKLMTLAQEDPTIFDFPLSVETMFKHHKDKTGKGRQIYRGNRTAKDIIFESQTEDFIPYSDDLVIDIENFDPEMDLTIGCGESCEVGHDF